MIFKDIPSLANPEESSVEPLLRQFGSEFAPGSGVQQRIKQKLQAKMSVPRLLEQAKNSIQPSESVSERVWSSIRAGIEPIGASSVFDQLKEILSPSDAVAAFIKQRMTMRLQPAYAPAQVGRIKWVAAFVLVVLAVRISPLLFLAPSTVAESPLILLPTKGEVSVLIGGLWQPVSKEMRFEKSALLQTHEGEATLVLHDDGVIRLAPHTTVALHDTSDRPEEPEHDSTLTLHGGEIWVQGLVPGHLQGLSVVTSQGKVIVHEGSFSVKEGVLVEVRVWDRKAEVVYTDKELPLVAGEGLDLTSAEAVFVKEIDAQQYQDEWVSQNLRRDAVHRREIAQLQHERRAALAGILPTSSLYAVKRVAEKVDVLFTFGEEAKTQKRLDQANTRLNEAAALIAEGNKDAQLPLQEYKDAVMEIATGSGQGTLVQFLIEQQLRTATAEVAAALPDDQSYLLKKTVLETSAAVPGSGFDPQDLEGVLLVDTLASLMRSVEEGNVGFAKETFGQLKPYLTAMGTGAVTLTPEMKKEAEASLSTFAVALDAYEDDVGGIDPDFLKDIEQYLPKSTIIAATVAALPEADVDLLVQQIYNRIFTYKLPRSRWNQLMLEFKSLDGNPNQAQILRKLYRELPENGLARYVPSEFERLKEEKGVTEVLPAEDSTAPVEPSQEGQL